MGNVKSDSEKLIDFCQGRSATVHKFSISIEICAEKFALDSEYGMVSVKCCIQKCKFGLNVLQN